MTESDAERPGQGFMGRILHVDLSRGTHEYEPLSESFYRAYLSGVGLAARVLWDRMAPGVDPLGPDNILGLVSGLLTGTGADFSGRWLAVAKSPATASWGDANCGGDFSPAIKRCGIDGVFFSGRSDRPVYVLLTDQSVEIKDAGDLWGLDAIEAESRLREAHGKRSKVACIGPAGEKLSYMAGIANDGGRYAARSGLGAVMGSKNLKAVVADGRAKIRAADPDQMKELSRAFRKRLESYGFLKRAFSDRLLGLVGAVTRIGTVYPRQPAVLWRLLLKKYGTCSLTALSAESGDSPIKNWAGVGSVDFPLKKSQRIGADSVKRLENKKYGCYNCPLRCGGEVTLQSGPHAGTTMHKPEYETICAFGGLALMDDLDAICQLNDLVNRGGVDSISCGATAAFAIECFEKGIITEADTGGLRLAWGDSEAIIRLTEMIINREGFGDVLADGVKEAARRIGRGAEGLAVHAGGMEAPMHDPKFDPGFAAPYQFEPTPGRHTITSLQYLDMQHLEKTFSRAARIPSFSTNKSRYRYDDKAAQLVIGSYYKMLIDGAGLCLFGTQVGGDLPVCQWLNAATGWDLTPDDYLEIGERIEQLRHAFNVREGLNPVRDFKMHPRIYGDPPLEGGPAKEVTIDMETLAETWYAAMGWDLASGRPELDRLKRLGLGDVAEALTKSVR